jgi:hypothetical protein
MKNKNITFKIFKQNETYYFQNIELSIFHHSNNLQEGYNFCQQKAVENLGSYDSAKTLIKYQKNFDSTVSKSLKSLLIENIVRSIFLIASIFILIFILSLSITSTIKKNEIKGGKSFWKKLEQEVVRSSEKEIDPKTQKKIIAGIRKIISNYKPFYDEITKIND